MIGGIDEQTFGRLFAGGACLIFIVFLLAALTSGQFYWSRRFKIERSTEPVFYWASMAILFCTVLGAALVALFGWDVFDG